MSDRKQLGKIKSATFGNGGYQDACIGLALTFGGASWGVSTFIGGWDIERNDRCRWTEEDRRNDWANAVAKLSETLKAARKSHVGELVGVPVECEFEGMTLKSWRVLTEVIED